MTMGGSRHTHWAALHAGGMGGRAGTWRIVARNRLAIAHPAWLAASDAGLSTDGIRARLAYLNHRRHRIGRMRRELPGCARGIAVNTFDASCLHDPLHQRTAVAAAQSLHTVLDLRGAHTPPTELSALEIAAAHATEPNRLARRRDAGAALSVTRRGLRQGAVSAAHRLSADIRQGDRERATAFPVRRIVRSAVAMGPR